VDTINARPAIALQIYGGLETLKLEVIVTRCPFESLYKMRYIKFGADNISVSHILSSLSVRLNYKIINIILDITF
jgi:hypothetical protein